MDDWWKEFLPAYINESAQDVSRLLDIDDDIYFCEKLKYFQIKSDFKEENEKLKKMLNGKEYLNDKLQWTLILSGEPNRKFYDEYISEIKGTVHFEHNDAVHRGHYIASVFKPYIVPKDFLLTDKVFVYFGKGNTNNIYYQSAAANCNSAKVRGQLYFEQKIDNFLKDRDVKKKVLFQIQDYRFLESQVSPGRRILGIFIENEEVLLQDSFHAFIPNGYVK